jgi:hypothetical protein
MHKAYVLINVESAQREVVNQLKTVEGRSRKAYYSYGV